MGGKKSFNFLYFERCSGKIADLRFDSDLLESYYSQCSFRQGFKRFTTATFYFGIVTLAYILLYHLCYLGLQSSHHTMMILTFIVALVFYIITYVVKKKKTNKTSLCYMMTGIALAMIYFILFYDKTPLMTIPFSFSYLIQLIIIIYALFPVRLWQALAITVPLSISHTALNFFRYDVKSFQLVIVIILGHICIHIVGLILLLMSQVRRRSTFLRLGHSCLMRQELRKEQKIRDDMICSLMPEKLAHEVLRDQNKDENSQNDQVVGKTKKKKRCIASVIGNNKGVHNHDAKESIDYLDSDDDDDDYSSQERKLSIVKNSENGDIRKVKVLVEFFNKEEQCYAIKHTKDEGMIKTYFVKRRFDDKEPYTLPLINVDAEKPVETEKIEENIVVKPETQPLNTKVDTNFKKRNDSDLLLALKEFNSDVDQVFSFPTISKFTLNFSNENLERAYRKIGMKNIRRNSTITWASPKMTQLINSVAFTIFFLLTLISCFISFPSLWKRFSPVWFISITIFGITIMIFILTVIIADFRYCVRTSQISEIKKRSNLSSKIFSKLFIWYPRNTIGAVMLFLPSALVLSNFDPCIFRYDPGYQCLLGLFFSFMLYSVTLFTMFSFWTKSLIATLIAALSSMLCTVQLFSKSCQIENLNATSYKVFDFNVPELEKAPLFNESRIVMEYFFMIWAHVILIWILNREFEVSARNSFEKYTEARQAKNQISREKLQADWLLANIIPSYIMEDLSATQKYSKHLPKAGVLFATIANFSEFYDEQYQGGQEMLRVLNEIFADFEHLLTSKKYKDVEKIKTIGACFMAASGLNLAEREKNSDPDAHLYALMDFASDLIRCLDDFNAQMFSFKFELKIGYNVGEVTAGVIGTTKLLYDIWGDAVNVASRMYSTGQKGKIQVTEDISKMLSSKFKFEYRGEVFVKGKGDMKTYLLVN